MKRLVYAPSIKVWVKSDFGVVDLSPYVTNCSIHRAIDDVSKAEITFRNPKVVSDSGKVRFLFTENESGNGKVGPVFHPMDPITIVFERIKGRPVQVFTGYCDTTPYVQLFPGVAKIKASCTLKRLLYTYWDPALPFVREFMKNYGWTVGNQGQAINEGQATAAERTAVNKQIKSVVLNDGSIGNLLYAVLHEVGGWNDGNIYVQPLPENIATTVSKLFNEFTEDNKRANKEISDLLKNIIGSGQYGSAVAASGATGGNNELSSVGAQVANAPTLPDNAPALVKSIFNTCNAVAAAKSKYLWGGNHDGNPATIDKDSQGRYLFDCSGFVSFVLATHNVLHSSSGEVSGWFANNWGKPGRGQYFTVWANDNHVFMEFYGKNGTSSCIGTNSSQIDKGHSASWHTHTTDGFVARHLDGC